VLLSDCELAVDDELRETLLGRLTYAMREAGMALAPDGPDIGDPRAATHVRLDTDGWIDGGGSLGHEATGLFPGRRRDGRNRCDRSRKRRALRPWRRRYSM
jgi:hypothetical protein